MKQIPILVNQREDCCGCGACENVCPQNAINMVLDKMGFFYPEINEKQCISCGCCIKVCVMK